MQNFLICVEMFIAAIVHHYAFSYKPYIDPDFEGGHCCTAFLLIWDVSDVQSDIREHVSVVREWHWLELIMLMIMSMISIHIIIQQLIYYSLGVRLLCPSCDLFIKPICPYYCLVTSCWVCYL